MLSVVATMSLVLMIVIALLAVVGMGIGVSAEIWTASLLIAWNRSPAISMATLSRRSGWCAWWSSRLALGPG